MAQYVVSVFTIVSFVIGMFAFNYATITTQYPYMIWLCIVIIIASTISVLQLYVIERIFRKHFVLLKKQLDVRNELATEKERSDHVCSVIPSHKYVSYWLIFCHSPLLPR